MSTPGEGAVVPDDVVHVRIDPTVLVIPFKPFYERTKLETIEFHDGLHEIGSRLRYTQLQWNSERALERGSGGGGGIPILIVVSVRIRA